MKVYIGLNDIKPDGMGTAAMSLIRALKLQGYDVQTVHPWKDVTVKEFFEFNPIFLTDSTEPVMPDVCLRQMVEVINNDPECKVFTHFGSPNWGAVVPYLRGDIKTIVSCHSTTPSALKLTLANTERTDAYVAVGHEVVNKLSRHLGNKRRDSIYLIPSSIDCTSIKRKENYAIKDYLKILFLGRIEDVSKGCDKIPHIAKLLKKQGLNFKWDLLGYFHMGFEAKYTNLVAECGVEAELCVKGPYPASQIQSMLAEYDIMVVPSNYEGQGLSLIEGMAAGLPCVASDIESFRRAINQGDKEGILISKNDITGFADAIIKLANEEEVRRNMGSAACRRANKDYSLESFGKAYATVIEQVVNNGIAYQPLPIPEHYVMPSSLKPHLIARILPTWLKKIIKKYV